MHTLLDHKHQHFVVALICELDEQWRFVGSKAHQHWLLYTYTFGLCTDETYRELLSLLMSSLSVMITSDYWGSYSREEPKDKHLTGKIFIPRIKRNDLTLRTRIKRLARKTICFSRSFELHEKVIGAFIEKYMFYSLELLPRSSRYDHPNRGYSVIEVANGWLQLQNWGVLRIYVRGIWHHFRALSVAN